MKQIIIALIVTCTSIAAGAQSFLNKVPADASVVLKYSGENFSKNLPLKKIDSYNFVKEHLFKSLKIDTLTSLENLGINFEKDTYQYVSMSDSSINFVTLLNLKSVPQFMQLVQASYHAEIKPDKKNGYEFLTISPDTYLGWNDKQAVLVVTSYQNKKSYYDYSYATADTTAAAVTVADSLVVVDTVIRFTPPKIVMDEEIKEEPVKVKGKKPATGKKKPGAAAKAKGKAKAGKKKPAPAEESIEEIVADAPKAYYEDTVETAKREAWYKEQEKLTAAKQKAVADSIINSSFNSSIASIENEEGYKKIIDPAAHVSVWFNYENLLRQYWWYIFHGIGAGPYKDIPYAKDNKSIGFKSAMNVFFEKDKMRIEQKTFSPDADMANLGKDLYSSKQNPAFTNYINPDNIGYMSMSISTEAMATYYYKILKQYLANTPYVSEYSDLVNVYVDLLEIAIDEKALSELMPGNMLFVLHDMKTKTVTYTDYVYDDKDFKSKEVTKTKQELSPNFTFVMETKREGFMEKVANLPLKYTKKGKYNYQDRGGYYELVFDKDKYPVSSLYFMVKNDRVIVTTSKVVIDMTINNTGFNLDAETKNSVLNNNYSLKINTKKLIEQLNSELSTSLSKKISKYFEDNMGDVKMESSLKDGIMQGTTTMAITGTHTNSLEFFFNMMDSINDIIEKDKQEREKKVD